MLCALSIVLDNVASIRIGPFIKIGLSGIPNRLVDFLFGPAIGALYGSALDIVKYFISPDGPFFPGFTLSAGAASLIYGFVLYRKKLTVARVFVSQVLVKIIINIFLNTLWLKILYDRAVLAILPGRILTNAIMLPVDTALYFIILQAADRTLRPMFRDNQ